ncbi:MAG TPA: hypothetical protein DEH78_01795 [Solibacterales bacterium]|nr:hypothetical protein [Bryobacterales bacterium]
MSGNVGTFDPASHTYRGTGGRVLRSVTQILKGARLVEDYGKIDPFYAERGTAVHAACEYSDKGTLDRSTLDPQIIGYLKAWESFRSEASVEVREVEHRFYRDDLGFAGTIDRVIVAGTRPGILDIKTGSPAPWHPIQTAAYAHGLKLDREIVVRYALYLSADGKWKIRKHDDAADFSIWLSALELSNWRRKHGYD